MPTTDALERAAQAWCKEATSHLVMIPELAEEFAGILDAERLACCKLVCELCRAGQRYNLETNGHGKNLFQPCAARAIWDDGTQKRFASYLEANAPEILVQMREGLNPQQMAGAELTAEQIAAKAVDSERRHELLPDVKALWDKFLSLERTAHAAAARVL